MAWTYLGVLIWFGAWAISVQSQAATELIGTWSTKSNKTLTGPGFYDPSEEKLIEPDLTGISYSFTEDGHFESAYYRALANPTNPKCPKGLMQWQHGTYEVSTDGSIELEPISIDGRQLMSDPCSFDSSMLTRYNQTEKFKRFEVFTDRYHKILRLNLFKSDGAPMHPMYLALKPPQMLPTTTLQASATATADAQSRKARRKRDLLLDRYMPSIDANAPGVQSLIIDANSLWWFGVFMTGIGSILYFIH